MKVFVVRSRSYGPDILGVFSSREAAERAIQFSGLKGLYITEMEVSD